MRFRAAILLVFLSCPTIHAEEKPFDWQSATPATQGLSPEKLDALRDSLATKNTKALLIIRHDRIVCEWYAEGQSADKPQGTASLAKALVGGMSLAVAMNDGKIRPDDLAANYIPEWKVDPRKSKITIAQLATHTSGLEDAEEKGIAHDKLEGWKGDFWRRTPGDPFTISRDRTPVVLEPGAKTAYSNPGMGMLAYAITAAIHDGPQKDLRALLRERILRPIGVKDSEWSVGYGQTYHVGDLDLVADWGGAAFTPRATARVGRLMLRQGDWNGKRLIDPKVIEQILNYRSPAEVGQWSGPSSPRPVLGWYTNVDKIWPAAPRDAFAGAGAGHQVLLVIPSLDLILVRNGAQLPGGDKGFWAAIEKEIITPLMGTITDPPYPPSDVIKRVRFDPPDTIIRKALDSDNWPMTWGDDDAIYTAYGDGRGFEPFVQKKLSLGIAKVDGTPPDFLGVNLRAETIERTGDGKNGAKASGLLMLDGVLYMWIRNTANATLAWSSDHGNTWTWGFKFNESFGCPTFLNFGRNYRGAKDEYVYVYSQDADDAYTPADSIVLARVHKDKIRDRSAYEFFTGSDDRRLPIWRHNISDRTGVFWFAGHCERLDAVFNPALGRCLLAVSYGHGRGWGLYDAPSPWGPWSAAFSTADWGLGQTHGYRLPAKWITNQGREIWMVFSGTRNYDAFCVRRMALEIYPDERPR